MLEWLNALPANEAEAQLLTCCGSTAFARRLAAARPFADRAALAATADAIWAALAPADWHEAFAAHPRIGSRKDVAKKSAATRAWSEGEQAGMDTASAAVAGRLVEANAAYEARFGHIYLVCATGRTAEELLATCLARLDNAPDVELRVAAEEQRKITHLRLEKLLTPMAKITTHVLDTARGRPAAGVPVTLERLDPEPAEIGRGVTDDDGRLRTLVPDGAPARPGTYRITFDVSAYDDQGFFPRVAIEFVVRDAAQHHHVPLLLSPFGYSTYRGS